jgi:hypothetical protein
MAQLPNSLEQALGKLQQLARRPATTSEAEFFGVRLLPTDVATPSPQTFWPAFELGSRVSS